MDIRSGSPLFDSTNIDIYVPAYWYLSASTAFQQAWLSPFRLSQLPVFAILRIADITVPAGYLFGLPVGISFFAKAWQEPALIKFAYAFEQATEFRRQPRFLPTASLNP